MYRSSIPRAPFNQQLDPSGEQPMPDAAYRFIVRHETSEAPKIVLEPADQDAVIPGKLAFKLKPGIELPQAQDLRQLLSDKVFSVDYKARENTSDVAAAWIIGPYLVLHTLVLAALALSIWIASGWQQLPGFSSTWANSLSADKFALFQRLVLSACAAGLGGGVYMIGEFYTKFCYGRGGEFLERKEIPRYVLLPFSSIVLGPIALGLTKAGAISFGGLSANTSSPLLTVVAVSFILGFTYHDTLNWLRKLSEKILSSKKDGESKPAGSSKAQAGAQPARVGGTGASVS
jgi:uncharacterized membrane protein YciS (DUF1049 family)